MNPLENVDLSLTLSDLAFKHVYKRQRSQLYDLGTAAYSAKLPSIIVFEGWDAAGKGTTIRHLTRRLDPRGFKVIAVQAPQEHEQMRPWLWRFWMDIPRHGQIAIFDRSWYGRVTIERVEKLTPIPDWIRAYEEINEFERTLAADGTLILKFWLHISRETQLRRFAMLAQDPERAWEVTAEDWERHRKYDAYLSALKDMLNNTNTPHAPWTVVPATDMNYRIYRVLSEAINAFERTLGFDVTPWPEPAELEAEAMEHAAEKEARKAARKAAKQAAAERQDGQEPDAAAEVLREPAVPLEEGAAEESNVTAAQVEEV